MSLTARRWLYSSFIIAFFAITTLVVSYANGYTINWTSGRLIKTGTFVFNTSPAGAKIFLNGQQQIFRTQFGKKVEILTPAKIKNVLPGEYLVRFELDGYHPWEKKLTIKSGESTYAETVELFTDTKPLALSTEIASDLRLSDDQSYLTWRTENKINIFDLKNKSSKLEVVNRSRSYSLQDTGKHLLVDDILYASDLAVPMFSVSKLVGPDVKNVQFVKGQDKVAYSYHNRIDTIAMSNQNITSVLISTSSDIMNFIAYDKQLEVISASSSRYFWQFYDNGKLDRSLELPVGNYNFKWLSGDWLSMNDADREISYVVNVRSTDAPIKTIKHCRKISFIKDNDFLCSNEYEIFTYDIGNSQSTLLDRLSEPVTAAYWHITNNYVIYMTKGAVYTLELDRRDFRNKTKIMDILSTDSAFNRENSTLYISGQYQDEVGIFVLNL